MLNLFKRLIWYRRHDSVEMIVINHTPMVLAKGTYTEDYDNAWFLALAKRSTVLLDIGANLGLHTMIGFSAGIKHSILIDANTEALAKAAFNAIGNGLVHRSGFYKGFVSDKDDDEVTFWTVGAGAAGSMYASHAKTAKQEGKSVKVNTITVDTLVALFRVEPDLIKIDVEGAENKVLQGARETARRYRPDFLVEMHSMPELSMQANATLILNWCIENGYAAYYLKEHCKITDPSAIKHRGRCHLLLMADHKPFPEELNSIAQGEVPEGFTKGPKAGS